MPLINIKLGTNKLNTAKLGTVLGETKGNKKVAAITIRETNAIFLYFDFSRKIRINR